MLQPFAQCGVARLRGRPADSVDGIIGQQIEVDVLAAVMQHVNRRVPGHRVQHAQIVLRAEAPVLLLAQLIAASPAGGGEEDAADARF